MKKFRKIRQYKDCIKGLIMNAQYAGNDEEGRPIYDKDAKLPVVTFEGTVKLHGTNAGIFYDSSSDTLSPQSRERVIDIKSDNNGFAAFVLKHEDFFKEFCREICNSYSIDSFTLFGEWCGGNIQKGVALNQLDKQFVIFAAYSEEYDGYMDIFTWNARGTNPLVFKNIYDYPRFKVKVDLADPNAAIEKITAFTDSVEANCPFGVIEGVNGIGEGIVWVYDDYCFKTKGEKHAGKGSGKKASVDPIKAANVQEFIDKTVTEDRLNQAYSHVANNSSREPMMADLGTMMKWIYNDIIDEEGDALVSNDLCAKDVSGAISNRARPFFIDKINEF